MRKGVIPGSVQRRRQLERTRGGGGGGSSPREGDTELWEPQLEQLKLTKVLVEEVPASDVGSSSATESILTRAVEEGELVRVRVWRFAVAA